MYIVQKFGGTSMGSIEKITNVAHKVIKEIKAGNKVVVVASAMSGETNRIVGLFNDTVKSGNVTSDILAEYDSMVSTGEQVSCALLAVVLNTLGYKARSITGWQLGFKTSHHHSNAIINDIETSILMKLLSEGIIPVVTGFQGIIPETNRQTTIGRGGSDTSAIAIAAALKAQRCDIYTDVDGIYTADPRIVKNARKLRYVGHEEMIEMASSGAKVLEPRSVMIGMTYNLDIQVLSSLEENPQGTILTNDNNIMERRLITGVTSNKQDVEITVEKLPNTVDTAAKLFGVLSEANITVDMIVQSSSNESDRINITFTVNGSELKQTQSLLDIKKQYLDFHQYNVREDVAKISVIGIGMKVNSGIAHTVFAELAKNNIKPLAISTSEIKISILVEQKYEELAVRCLHDIFRLGTK